MSAINELALLLDQSRDVASREQVPRVFRGSPLHQTTVLSTTTSPGAQAETRLADMEQMPGFRAALVSHIFPPSSPAASPLPRPLLCMLLW